MLEAIYPQQMQTRQLRKKGIATGWHNAKVLKTATGDCSLVLFICQLLVCMVTALVRPSEIKHWAPICKICCSWAPPFSRFDRRSPTVWHEGLLAKLRSLLQDTSPRKQISMIAHPEASKADHAPEYNNTNIQQLTAAMHILCIITVLHRSFALVCWVHSYFLVKSCSVKLTTILPKCKAKHMINWWIEYAL